MGGARGGTAISPVPLLAPFFSCPSRKNFDGDEVPSGNQTICQGVIYSTSFFQDNINICNFLHLQILKSRQICGLRCMSKSQKCLLTPPATTRYIFSMHTTTEIRLTFGPTTKKFIAPCTLSLASPPVALPASDSWRRSSDYYNHSNNFWIAVCNHQISAYCGIWVNGRPCFVVQATRPL